MAAQESPSLKERLDKIKSPKLQNQKEARTAVVLSAIEENLKDQRHDFTPTAYFAALLALLRQSISQSAGIVNKELATAVVYLLDTVASYVPAPLLRSKFSHILSSLAPALTQQDVEAPILRHSMGCLETLLLAQDSASWSLPHTQVGPRGAVAGILSLAVDHRPKVRKRAQEALTKVLENAPPSPSIDHPAADMCAETALHSLRESFEASERKQKGRNIKEDDNHPSLIHALQLIRTIAAASGGWPSRRIDPLCEVLLGLSKSNNEYLATMSFQVFETIIAGMASESSSMKLPRLLEAVSTLRPSQNDSQLLPPWIAVIARGYDVSAQLDAEQTFSKLPELFEMISSFLTSPSHNIRISASECLISFTATCIPRNVVLDPSQTDEDALKGIARAATNLLSIKYQAAWMEVFNVLTALFEALKWRSTPYLDEIIKLVGDLRGNDSFNGKKEADIVLGQAIAATGPKEFLRILPLNLDNSQPDQPGRAWLLPLLRDNVMNATIKHFRSEFVPLSELMFQKVIDHGKKEKTMEVKIFETVVSQIWSILPGYCTLSLDLADTFDREFAELLSNLLYQQTQLRTDICNGLQALVESNKQFVSVPDGEEDLLLQHRITKGMAQKNLEHLSMFAGNLLAVLFNVYSGTLPHHRGYILQCINAYLSITPEKELQETFERVIGMLEGALKESTSQTQSEKQKQKKSSDQMPPTSHTLIDLLITMSVYLPRSSYQKLFSVTALLLPQSSDTQLQKKAYKLLPRLATSAAGLQALKERNADLQELLLSTAESASPPARRDRLDAIAVVVENLSASSLYFIPSILSEVVVSVKELNEKARSAAFDLLVQMGKKMTEGGTVVQSKIPHMPNDAPTTKASLEEYFTMLSAGLAGTAPHMISASITATTRVLYEFRSETPDRVLEELVSTIDLFLTSKSREIVRSVLGFAKVAIISLPDDIMIPRLPTMIPSLISWGHEHANKFRAKVRNILERAIRRFGYEAIERHCPEDDKKLLHNIQKTKERKKRKKATAATAEAEGEEGERVESTNTNKSKGKSRSKFESEFDAAVYDSAESSDAGSGFSLSDSSDNEASSKQSGKGKPQKQKQTQSKSYIIEPSSPSHDPLDLLDRNAYASVSSTKPMRLKDKAALGKNKTKAKTNLDGKLVFDEDDDDENMSDVGDGKEPGDGTLEGGINAYVAAIRGQDTARRGRGGKLKFSNRGPKGEVDEMDLDDEEELDRPTAKSRGKEKGRGGERNGSGRGAKNGKSVPQRRGLESGKRRDQGGGAGGSGGMKGGRFKVAKQRGRGGSRSSRGGVSSGRVRR